MVAKPAKPSEHDSDVCPVCLLPPSETVSSSGDVIPFCVAPCRHSLCRLCAERVLYHKDLQHRHKNNSESKLSFATQGKCPTCRHPMSMFDLTNATPESAPAFVPAPVPADATAAPTNPSFPKNYDFQSWPIRGFRYAQRRHDRLLAFESGLMVSDVCFDFSHHTPQLRFTMQQSLASESESVLKILEFTRGKAHFHSKSCTFHGEITVHPCNPIGHHRIESILVMLQFSRDFRFIADGYIEETLQATSPQEFPMDGTWKVTWPGHQPDTFSASITLYAHHFSLYGLHYDVKVGEDGVPYFSWPADVIPDDGNQQNPSVVQTATGPIDRAGVGQGANIGDVVEWTTTNRDFGRIVWCRMQRSAQAQTPRLTFVTPSQSLAAFERVVSTVEPSRPKYHSAAPWGNTFCQGLRVGLASYHFGAASDDQDAGGLPPVHISYEHPFTSQWPSLDNGSPVPSQVPFHNTSWDPAERVFRGDICWQQDYGTTWQSCRRWSYEMQFDKDFTCIVSGQVKSLLEHATETTDMSSFGTDLVYVNAAIEEHFRQLWGAMNNDVSNEDNNDDPVDGGMSHRFSRLYRGLRSQWEAENASHQTIMMLTSVCMKTLIDGGEDVIELR